MRAAMGRAGRVRVEREFQLAECTRTIVDVMEKAIAMPTHESGSRSERPAPAAA